MIMALQVTLNWEVLLIAAEDWHTIPSCVWILVIDVKKKTMKHWGKNADDLCGDEYA
jgi:hypothetical protein